MTPDVAIAINQVTMAQNETQPDKIAAIHMESDLSRGMVAWDSQSDTQNPRWAFLEEEL